MEFKDILKKELKAQKISAYKLSKMTGITQQNISNYINGKHEPTIHNLRLICEYLDVSADYMIGRKEY